MRRRKRGAAICAAALFCLSAPLLCACAPEKNLPKENGRIMEGQFFTDQQALTPKSSPDVFTPTPAPETDPVRIPAPEPRETPEPRRIQPTDQTPTGTASPEDRTPAYAPTETPVPTETPAPTGIPTPTPAPEDGALVPLAVCLPEVFVDLRYATSDNFTGQAIYESGEAYLRYGTVRKLKKAAAILREKGLCLKIWDAWRPAEAQFRLFEICPDPRFVADPRVGFSNHSRGGTVDITLCTPDGTELEMPSAFDDFSERADRDYGDCTDRARGNALLLEKVMTQCGFSGYAAEWWHYNDTDPYGVIKER